MRALLVLLLLTAEPKKDCEALWTDLWAALAVREPAMKDSSPLFRALPDAEQRLHRAWVAECKAFSSETLACARGEALRRELAELEAQLTREKVPPDERRAVLARVRGQWSILDCKDADRAIDRAAAAVARDAGLE